ncbi:MAG TPA: amidohydrolase family protein [Rhizomicrobium sp.]|nr:amidohydrolase family protein [Rhizomicrobium sp.]
MLTHTAGEDGGAGCPCCQPTVLAAEQRITREMSRRGMLAGTASAVAGLGLASAVEAAVASLPIVFTNFKLFDGKSSGLRSGLNLLIEGGRIKDVAGGATGAPGGAKMIDCGGHVLMPGLIDAHWHTMFAGLALTELMKSDIDHIVRAASAQAERTLMRGFTTVRDLGGPAFPLKKAIDAGQTVGPRIYPSGAMITTTGGHGDMRPVTDFPRNPAGPLSNVERSGGAAIADSADEVRLRVREQFVFGASQIKLVAGGGVSSPRTTLDMLTFTVPELHAGVQAAADRNTYAAVHAYPSAAIRRAIEAGTRCIEHGHLMDDATAKLMADKGVWLSTQPFVVEDDAEPLTGQSHINFLQVIAGTGKLYALAKKYGIKTAFGSDMLFSPRIAERQGMMLTHLKRWYGNADILKMATSVNAELLALSGPRNPYPGRLGVIENGAYADLLVVADDPLKDIDLLAAPDKNLLLIMKSGKIHKDIRAAK